MNTCELFVAPYLDIGGGTEVIEGQLVLMKWFFFCEIKHVYQLFYQSIKSAFKTSYLCHSEMKHVFIAELRIFSEARKWFISM